MLVLKTAINKQSTAHSVHHENTTLGSFFSSNDVAPFQLGCDIWGKPPKCKHSPYILPHTHLKDHSPQYWFVTYPCDDT